MSDIAPVPKWFRFKPTEEELITYLNLKTQGKESELDSHIAEIDHICKWEPWELPFMSKMDPNNGEWWFLCRPDYKNSHSNRSNRRTKIGHWKITGKERNTKDCNGRKRILVFYEGPSPGKRTDWVLHEYYSLQPNISVSLQKPAYVICRLKRKYHEKGDTPDCSECELSPTSEMASDLGNSLVSAPTTPVNNFISSPQHQLCSPELCNIVQALFDEDMPEFSCDKIEKCYGEFLNLVSAHPGEYNSGETNITYNSPNMSDSSKSSYVDGPVSNDTHTTGVKDRYRQTWRAQVHLVRLLAPRKSRVSEWGKHQVKLYIILWVKFPSKKQLFPLFISVSKWIPLLLITQRHSKRSSVV